MVRYTGLLGAYLTLRFLIPYCGSVGGWVLVVDFTKRYRTLFTKNALIPLVLYIQIHYAAMVTIRKKDAMLGPGVSGHMCIIQVF